jgi:hypothetical protein
MTCRCSHPESEHKNDHQTFEFDDSSGTTRIRTVKIRALCQRPGCGCRWYRPRGAPESPLRSDVGKIIAALRLLADTLEEAL